MKSIPYGRQHITPEDIDAVVTTLQSEFLTQGPKVAEFETKFAEYVGSKYAVAVSNGTAALHLSAIAMGVKSGDKVITTPITFAASANCIKYCGGDVLFSDIDPDTFLLDISKLEDLIKENIGSVKGIIPVDFAGLPVNLEALKQIADKYNLWIIEDACHAPGGFFNDSKGMTQYCGSGNFADLAIFSFHPVKHIATGEGGMITTNNKELYDKLVLLRTHGITKNPELMTQMDGGWFYEMMSLGYNYRLTDMQAALGISQLSRADEGIKKRFEISARYNEAFKNLPVTAPYSPPGHAFHLYIIKTNRRAALYEFLKARNIICQVHYIPVHTMPYYKMLGWEIGDMPIAESYYEKCLSLPMFPSLTSDEQQYVIQSVREFFK
jgi:UDP-4-amino-4,6-dideoxy-N-acetyl-beta-L-altrosamine transaminase